MGAPKNASHYEWSSGIDITCSYIAITSLTESLRMHAVTSFDFRLLHVAVVALICAQWWMQSMASMMHLGRLISCFFQLHPLKTVVQNLVSTTIQPSPSSTDGVNEPCAMVEPWDPRPEPKAFSHSSPGGVHRLSNSLEEINQETWRNLVNQRLKCWNFSLTQFNL